MMYLEICSIEIGSANRKSATHKHLLGAPTANSQVATFVEGLLICGFEIYETYLRTVHLCMPGIQGFRYKYSFHVLSSIACSSSRPLSF
jgi:hypothetical protein